MTQTPTEIMARACFDPGKFIGVRPDGETLDQWRARACDKALTDAGYAVVPVEPTEAMLDAGVGAAILSDDPTTKGIYKAMLAARQE